MAFLKFFLACIFFSIVMPTTTVFAQVLEIHPTVNGNDIGGPIQAGFFTRAEPNSLSELLGIGRGEVNDNLSLKSNLDLLRVRRVREALSISEDFVSELQSFESIAIEQQQVQLRKVLDEMNAFRREMREKSDEQSVNDFTGQEVAEHFQTAGQSIHTTIESQIEGKLNAEQKQMLARIQFRMLAANFARLTLLLMI